MLASRSFARTLRTGQTDAEALLWSRLRNRKLEGFKFRRQVPLEGYVADFACIAARLVIELDGLQHAEQTAYDNRRTRALQAAGFAVLRFWNGDVLTNIEGVLEVILDMLRPNQLLIPDG